MLQRPWHGRGGACVWIMRSRAGSLEGAWTVFHRSQGDRRSRRPRPAVRVLIVGLSPGHPQATLEERIPMVTGVVSACLQQVAPVS